MRMPAIDAVKRAMAGGAKKRFPGKTDPRYRHGMIVPAIDAHFQLAPGMTVFTIGSCFARNIEEELDGFVLPTRDFAVPEVEWPHRPNGLLNEYNPASMAQRIAWALTGADTSGLDAALVGDDEAILDLLLPVGAPVMKSRAHGRRAEIDEVYRALGTADALILTLGLVECWEDREAGMFLNRMPPIPELRRYREKYLFHRLSPAEALGHLAPAFESLINHGVHRIILTVSPVPLQTTVTGQDCVLANTYSKASLRIVAEELCRRFPCQVCYFPSYEMVMSLGTAAFLDDLVHVRPRVVADIMEVMRTRFVAVPAAA